MEYQFLSVARGFEEKGLNEYSEVLRGGLDFCPHVFLGIGGVWMGLEVWVLYAYVKK